MIAGRREGWSRSPRHVVTALLTALMLVLTACASDSDSEPTSTETRETATTTPDVDPIGWSDCDGGECAVLPVPIDHDDPEGETLDIALMRASKADEDQRIGSLLLNPGGPGASGVSMARHLQLPEAVTERFDIVGFDPRGVGDSSPLDCHDHLQDMYDADPTMDDASDRQAFMEVSQRFVDQCENRHGELLEHLGTEAVARDLDLMVEALGDEELNYLGFSYGTVIGQQYARLFPSRVRTMVLDGVADPTVGGLRSAVSQARGFEEALNRFIDRCDERECVGGDTADVIDTVIASSESEPIPAPEADRPATPGVVHLALAQGMYSSWSETDLTRSLIDAHAGDGSGLVNLADHYLGRVGDDYPSGFEVYFAVSCLDSDWPQDPNVVFAVAEAVAAEAPRNGEALVNDYVRCALWPTEPQPLEPIPPDVQDLAPILMVSTTGDAATPHETAEALVERIPRSALLTHEGEGHTIVASGNDCVDDIVTEYLVGSRIPEGELLC